MLPDLCFTVFSAYPDLACNLFLCSISIQFLSRFSLVFGTIFHLKIDKNWVREAKRDPKCGEERPGDVKKAKNEPT